MSAIHIRDQRGVAVVFELIIVALVLALAGLAVYQANHHEMPNSESAAVNSGAALPPEPLGSATDIAASAAAAATQAATAEATIAASADKSVTQLSDSTSDATNLGSISNVSF